MIHRVSRSRLARACSWVRAIAKFVDKAAAEHIEDAGVADLLGALGGGGAATGAVREALLEADSRTEIECVFASP